MEHPSSWLTRVWLVWLAACCCALPLLWSCGESEEATGPGGGTGGTAGSGGTARFPLTVTPGERFLREASGEPFFFHGDTGWSLMAQLTREEANGTGAGDWVVGIAP